MRVADGLWRDQLRQLGLPDVHRDGQLPRRMALSDLLWLLHLSVGLVRDHRRLHELRERAGLLHVVEFLHLPRLPMSGNSGPAADVWRV